MSIPDHGPSAAPPGAWEPARRAANRLVTPIQRILAVEAASGVVLLAAAAIALIWANSAWGDSYQRLLAAPVGVQLGDASVARPLQFWVNEGLMTLFFFVVGIEIRREIHEGDLSELRRAALPLAAAFGGMMVPAAIYAILNAGRAGSAGWGIPMATDIAFAVGVLTVLGDRVSASVRVLLLALAVIDDLGAIAVIAVFYNHGGSLDGAVMAAGGVGAVLVLKAVGVRSTLAYVVPGVVLWTGCYRLGIHPTIAGVILGMMAPVRPWFGPARFARATAAHLDGVDAGTARDELQVKLAAIEQARREAISPAERLLFALHPWVAFVVMPVFALANAGVVIGGADLSGDALYVFLGVGLGLALGKPLGIFVASLLATSTGLARRGPDVTHHGVLLVGVVGGIGFTMSLFVAQLAFPPGPMLDTAKLAVLAGSGAAAVVGVVVGLARRGVP